jgi:hypothetical protein
MLIKNLILKEYKNEIFPEFVKAFEYTKIET